MCEGILLILTGLDLYHSASTLFHLIFHETTNSVSPLDLAVHIIALMTLLLAYHGRVRRSIAGEVVLPVMMVNGFKQLLAGQFITFGTNDATIGKIMMMLVNVLFLPGLSSNAQQLCCSQTQRAEADEKKALEPWTRLELEINELMEGNDRLLRREEKFLFEVFNNRLELAILKAADEKKVLEREVNRLSALSGERFFNQEELQRDVDRIRNERDVLKALLKKKEKADEKKALEREVDRLRKERNEGREAMDHLMKEKEALKRDVDRLRKERNEGREAMVAYKNDVEAFLRQKGQEERAKQLLKAGLQILGLFFGVPLC
jgi:regulator of replication initiation timing